MIDQSVTETPRGPARILPFRYSRKLIIACPKGCGYETPYIYVGKAVNAVSQHVSKKHMPKLHRPVESEGAA